VPAGLELRLWRDDDLPAAARLISEAYLDHPDSVINDQYRSIYGSLRFLNNIVRHSGCGEFVPHASSVLVVRKTGELAALVLGSRVSPESGHITQVCVHPSYRRLGLARMLLSLSAASFLRLGAKEVSLTVTEANSHAVQLYHNEGYQSSHVFDAAVWERSSRNFPPPAE
jgi:ribosomal protein S18 acetylase RimI-like enzyme